MTKRFRLDRGNGKLWGVCAGIAEYTGVDVTLVRVAAVVVTLLGAFPWTVIAYGATALIAKNRDQESRRAPARISTYDVKHNVRDIDRRMAEVEQYVAGSNTALAREIDSLR